tara:strand:- start:142 stop:597 length:456 start_codon:yes stop_codon:yes gene_type:complete
MSDITLRPFDANDSERIIEWFHEDRAGFEQLMGISIPDDFTCTMAVTSLLHAQEQGHAVVRMVDRGEKTIGTALLTNVVPDEGKARPHLYVIPSARRYSITAARASEAVAKALGIGSLFTTVSYDNKQALALARRLGYGLVPQALLVKELS